MRDGLVSYTDLRPLFSGRADPLPYVLRVVLENLVRNGNASDEIVESIAHWTPESPEMSVPISVSRVILPDSSGLPALMDLAALRGALVRKGLDAGAVQPKIPVDLVIDHSLLVDRAGSPDAEAFNVRREFERNGERYSFFKWAQQAFDNLRVVPPGMGIIHQVHIERLAKVIATENRNGNTVAYPEFILGGDSHTPMVNALGVLGWGVGGIEAEAALLGKPYMIRIPRVVGVRLTGTLREGATTTDLVLKLTQELREIGVVGDFVEFTGPSLDTLTTPERATLANMAPEYGATVGFFPIDARTIDYLRQTGRDDEHIALVETAAKAIGIFRDPDAEEPAFSELIEIDLSGVEPSLAGPRRPQDRIAISDLGVGFRDLLEKSVKEGGFGVAPDQLDKRASLEIDGRQCEIRHGSIAVAAITSCTNTSNPSVMIGAGLLAKRAVERGLVPPVHVKTSLAPGSRVVTRYLREAGLLTQLEALGFHVVGYGCTTCSGKSGPLSEAMDRTIEDEGIVAAAVLSGNRNFEGRIHRRVRANYIASPMLVIAYALAGRVDINLEEDPIGQDPSGKPVFLSEIWPSNDEISEAMQGARDPALFKANYETIFDGTDLWQALKSPSGPLFPWPAGSTYLQEPPFFAPERTEDHAPLPDVINEARVLCAFGDSLTTDHIIPSGEIPGDSLAGKYLLAQGVSRDDFNAVTQRRGNHDVMMRATFANIRIKNLLIPDQEGGVTIQFPEGERKTIFEAAEQYRNSNTPIIVLGGKDYGMGSSRDWATKGPALLGVQAVIAESFERIHRSNLIGMGIIPLRFTKGESWRQLGLDGSEAYSFQGLCNGVRKHETVAVEAHRTDGKIIRFDVTVDITAAFEIDYLNKGGIFPTVFHEFKTVGNWSEQAVRSGSSDTPTAGGVLREETR